MKHRKKAEGPIGWNNKDEDNSLNTLGDKKYFFLFVSLVSIFVSLFNGISTLAGYLKPKLVEE